MINYQHLVEVDAKMIKVRWDWNRYYNIFANDVVMYEVSNKKDYEIYLKKRKEFLWKSWETFLSNN